MILNDNRSIAYLLHSEKHSLTVYSVLIKAWIFVGITGKFGVLGYSPVQAPVFTRCCINVRAISSPVKLIFDVHQSDKGYDQKPGEYRPTYVCLAGHWMWLSWAVMLLYVLR